MIDNFEEHRSGTYKEPFTQIQYGVFAIDSRDGSTKFVGTGLSHDIALVKANNYYKSTDADDSEIETFFVRTRTVTYAPWRD